MTKEKVIPQMIVASAHHHVASVTDDLIEKFSRDFEIKLAEAGAAGKKPENFYTVFHVNEYREYNYDMELWLEVEELMENTESIQYQIVPESEAAYVVVSETYENLKPAYDELFAFVKSKNYSICGYPRETYLPDPSAQSGFLTEIQLPFHRKRQG